MVWSHPKILTVHHPNIPPPTKIIETMIKIDQFKKSTPSKTFSNLSGAIVNPFLEIPSGHKTARHVKTFHRTYDAKPCRHHFGNRDLWSTFSAYIYIYIFLFVVRRDFNWFGFLLLASDVGQVTSQDITVHAK